MGRLFLSGNLVSFLTRCKPKSNGGVTCEQKCYLDSTLCAGDRAQHGKPTTAQTQVGSKPLGQQLTYDGDI
jgi:hypothetical protein